MTQTTEEKVQTLTEKFRPFGVRSSKILWLPINEAIQFIYEMKNYDLCVLGVDTIINSNYEICSPVDMNIDLTYALRNLSLD